MDWVNKDIEKLPRKGKFAFRVKMLYFSYQHLALIKNDSTPEDMLEITIRLKPQNAICRDIINGIPIHTNYPNIVWKKPGMQHSFYNDCPREVIAFGYSTELIGLLREAGMYPDENSLSFKMTPEIERLADEFRQLCSHLYTPGVVDRLDWICFSLYREVLYSNFRKPEEKDDVEKLHNISLWLQIHFSESIDLNWIARKNGFSRASFFRKWKALFHSSPIQYILNLKIKAAADLLRTTDTSINNIVREIHFSGTTAFHKRFYQTYGMTPREYRNSSMSIDSAENE